MTLHIDLDSRTLRASVGALARAGSGREIGLAGGGLARLWVGQQHHRRIQERRRAEVEGYRAEVTVTGTLRVDDWTLELSGRADGVVRDAAGTAVEVEEVKTVLLGRDLFAAGLGSTRLAGYRRQVRLYARLLSDPDRACSAVLTLVDVADGRAVRQEVDWSPGRVDAELRRLLRRLVAAELELRSHREACAAAAATLPFPHPSPRPAQRPMMDAVETALDRGRRLLVCAPTGVGKTAAALYPSLRHALAHGKQLFFLTAKTLQQRMAVETVRAMQSPDAPWHSLQLRAKGRMCASDEMVCHEDVCPYAADYVARRDRAGVVDALLRDHRHLDPDDVVTAGEAATLCPFELSLDLLPHAEVVIGDYNYVFDPRIGLRALLGDDALPRTVLVVDEAHNLVERARETYSPALSATLLRDAVDHAATRSSRLFDELASSLRQVLDLVEDHLDAAIAPDALGTETLTLDPEPLLRARMALDPLVVRYVQYKREAELWAPDDPIMAAYFALVHLHRVLALGGDEFVHLAQRTPDDHRVKVLCLDASRFLAETFGASGGTVAMSATLEPFPFYTDLLGLDPDTADTLSLPSPFPRDNVRVLIADQFSTTYRDRPRSYGPIADLIARIAPPGRNALVLLPSYAFLREIEERLELESHRVEVQRAGARRRDLQRMLQRLREGGRRPIMLLGVLGGMFAEGVDYPGDMLSQVVVVSPGLPQLEPERELLKDYYQATRGNGFAYAFLLPGLRRVVQAAGRLIRGDTDRGVIVLVGRRFLWPRYASFLPRYWTDGDVRRLRSTDPEAEVRAFFEETTWEP